MKAPRFFRSLLPFIVFTASAAATFLLLHEPVQGILPDTLDGLPLREFFTGRTAADAINAMHGKEVSSRRNAVGFYGRGDRSAMLTASIFSDTVMAERDYRRMADLIRRGSEFFGHYEELTIMGRRLSFCLGQGQSHVFFRHRSVLYWLAADPGQFHGLLRDLIHALSGSGPSGREDPA